MRHTLTTAGLIAAVALCTAAATPSPAAPVGSAGTTFLTAVAVAPAQPVHVAAVTGDYLYWSFTAEAGQRPDVTATVRLPPAADRHGAQAWTVEVFDGLRRRQSCVAGEQSPLAAAAATQVALRCQLRQVRSWAEPWDGDPLPGTYYVRLSSTELPDRDLGLPVQVDLLLAAPAGDDGADQGVLAAPLVPDNRPGSVLTGSAPASAAPVADDDDGGSWLPALGSRWLWTAGGGVLAAVAGLFGFSLTRRRPRAA
ncbi:peptidase [Actinoplanes sp. ATCC 53533]|uniref:peptidase n=1 Tax=Actinoplanes sp. ATCC 53533 TaxID=1288362 RepID=UPI000F772F8F|nr:peptidase [Actinoplanes sp. ATCC 53533]RSM58219.1 peptidase [Actinoplanes sp. ATCC 53533]